MLYIDLNKHAKDYIQKIQENICTPSVPESSLRYFLHVY